MKNNYTLLIFLLMISSILISCSSTNYNPINYTSNEGNFSKTKHDTIINEYQIDSNKGFYASIDFNLTEGKVDWEIVNSNEVTIFEGYVINENGKTYRELKYPQIQNGHMNKKEEVKEEPDFNYLQFEVGSVSGVYRLKFRPINAEGSYLVKWSDRLPRK